MSDQNNTSPAPPGAQPQTITVDYFNAVVEVIEKQRNEALTKAAQAEVNATFLKNRCDQLQGMVTQLQAQIEASGAVVQAPVPGLPAADPAPQPVPVADPPAEQGATS